MLSNHNGLHPLGSAHHHHHHALRHVGGLHHAFAPRADQNSNKTYVDEFVHSLNGVTLSLDYMLSQILWGVVGFVLVAVFIGRWSQKLYDLIRLVFTIDAPDGRRAYFARESSRTWPWIKKNILYAPLWGKRHNREMQLSSAVNMGTLPSRFHASLMLIYVLMNTGYMLILPWNKHDRPALIAEIRGRSGSLAVLNMIPLFILVARNNPLIRVLGVSFDTFNFFHRWFGRLVVAETILHVGSWATNALFALGFKQTLHKIISTPFFTAGFVGLIFMVSMALHSPSPIRHAFYETFLHTHRLMALIIVIAVYAHIGIDVLPQRKFFWVVPAVWFFERLTRFISLLRLNASLSIGKTQVVVEALGQEASRVTFYLPKNHRIPAGSHVYAYFPQVALWMNHPFSVAWEEDDAPRPWEVVRSPSDSTGLIHSGTLSSPDSLAYRRGAHVDNDSSSPKSPLSPYTPTGPGSPAVPVLPAASHAYDDLESQQTLPYQSSNPKYHPTRVSLLIASHSGMTKKLNERANSQPDGIWHTYGFIEGPYACHPRTFNSYGTVILFSGGAGITHHMLHVRNLLESIAVHCASTQKIILVWSIRHESARDWISPWMDKILRLPHRKKFLTVKTFVSKPSGRSQITHRSPHVQVFAGRCKPAEVLKDALKDHHRLKGNGAVAVSACGPGGFTDEVRDAARSNIGKGVVIDYAEESFSW